MHNQSIKTNLTYSTNLSMWNFGSDDVNVVPPGVGMCRIERLRFRSTFRNKGCSIGRESSLCGTDARNACDTCSSSKR